MTDLKVALKEAKNAIKDKDYEAAMIHCKDALKIDRKNYQALTMFGRVCLELYKFKDSKQALMLATQVDASNPIAWHGLSSLHEKNDTIFTREEEILILSHMREMTKDEEKLDKIVRRLANCSLKHGSAIEAVHILQSHVNLLSSDERAVDIRKLIIKALEDVNEPSEDGLEMLIDNYEQILNKSPLGENETNYQTYLQLVHKSKNYERLVLGCLSMSSIFPTACPLEWLFRAYVECLDSTKEFSFLSSERIKSILEKLLMMNRRSPWGNLAKGLLHKNMGEFENAKLHLRKGAELLETNLMSWLLLLNLQMETNDLGGIEMTCRKVLKLIEINGNILEVPSSVSNLDSLKNSLLVKHAMALTQLGHENHLLQAIAILEKIPDKNLDTSILYIKALTRVKNIRLASLELDKLKMKYDDENLPIIQEVVAFVARYSNDLPMALIIYEDVLQRDPTNSEVLLELGKLYFEVKDYQKSLINLLKAAKFNPNLSGAFLYIGHYYRVFNNLDRARKCYEKTLNLNPHEDEAGASLSDIYRITQDHESNLTLLVRITSEAGRSASGWAWLRLGLHHLSQKNCVEAIQALQCAVEINCMDRICYECLGEAYIVRGSHSAALKVFTKAVELDPKQALYSRCKIAYINQLIGEFLISITQYEEVLSEKLPYALRMVALVGLAEVLLARGKKYKRMQLLTNMKNDCLWAIKCLTRVVAGGEGKNFTVWKLLGDACTLQIAVPDSQSFFTVPTKLLDSSIQDLDTVTDLNKDEIMELGRRCYSSGLHIQEKNASLWHDLGVNIFMHNYKKIGDKIDDCKNEFDYALAAIKNSLTLDPTNFNAWNTLGVISFFKGNNQMAQHAFIHSLKLHPTVDGWTHLGALYLKQQDVHLAHEAFAQAQALDPGFVACWVGQAMVADAVGHYEAFDLYRHSTLLGIHLESCLGHAHKVLQIICQSPDKENIKTNMHSLLPNATDCLIFYTREEEKDIAGLNLCGLALETLHMKQSAARIYFNAIECCKKEAISKELQDIVFMNYGRTLISLNHLEEAEEAFAQMSKPDFYSQCGIALSKLKGGHYDEAYEQYTEALMWLAPNDNKKSHVFVALAFLQYKFHNIEQVKTLLFQRVAEWTFKLKVLNDLLKEHRKNKKLCSVENVECQGASSTDNTGQDHHCSIRQTTSTLESDDRSKSSSVLGLLALTSLGLLQADTTLADAALCELKSYANEKDYVHHIAFLKAAQAVMQGNYHKGKIILSNAILRHPHNASLWRFLSQHLLTMTAMSSGTSSFKTALAAKAAASAATKLAQAIGDNKNVSDDVVMKAMSYMQATRACEPIPEPKKKKDKNKIPEPKLEISRDRARSLSLIEAQRAVFMCPSKPQSWAMLIAAIGKKSQKTSQLAQFWSSKAKPQLKSWLESIQL